MAKTAKENITARNNKLLKCPTGIKGFDEISEGGLPQHGATFCLLYTSDAADE